MLRRRFAVIKLWPGVKAAEDEVIERLKIAAKGLGLECLVVDPSARLIQPPHARLTQQDVDFVLSLHFEAPKQFDIFSFVTLWNPLQFYYDWGYRKFTRHLLTHDDFLSCDSVSGDDHVMRLISNHPTREGPLLRFYPTLAGPILEPTLGDQQLFYAGMNWEKTANKPGRHDGLLGLLDESGDLRIYGPKIYGGVEVWKGYKSYVGPIPFDGVSVVRLINQAGISLVLSSQAHAQSEMMSSRIFESSAAGAVIICNENPFARRHFGDSLLYIDTTLTVKEAFRQVESHLDWIKSEPAKALELAKQAQSIFRENFRLDTCLEQIYARLPERKAKLECAYAPKSREEKICVVFLMPEFHAEILEQHIASCQAQKNVAIRGVLAVDARDAELFGPRGIRSRINESPAPLEMAPIHFMERRPDGSAKGRKRAGEVISEVLRSLVEEDEEYVCIVAPNERLFSDHLGSLLRVLQDSPEAGCAWSDMVQAQRVNDEERIQLCDDPDAATLADDGPLGSGRFLLRMSALQEHLFTALPYLDALAMHLLFGTNKHAPTRRCTLAAGSVERREQPVVPAGLEREILIDVSPEIFGAKAIPALGPESAPAPSFSRMTDQERVQLIVDLAHSVPLPAMIKKFAFGTYRLWWRMAGSRAPNGNK
jgi:hypothetical protein